MHGGNISKTHKENLEKGRGLGHVTPKILAYTLTYLQNKYSYSLQIWYTDAQWQYLKNPQRKISERRVT